MPGAGGGGSDGVGLQRLVQRGEEDVGLLLVEQRQHS